MYLSELYNQTGGNTESQVTMSDVGVALGLEKNEAGTTAEELIIQGFVDLKTLSGAIGITLQGIEALGLSPVKDTAESDMQLGRGPVLDDRGRQAVEILLTKIKTRITQLQTDYAILEECIIDIRTLETQLLSPSPKVEIIREILRSISTAINTSGRSELSNELEMILES